MSDTDGKLFPDIYPSPHTGGPLKAKDMKNWFGVKGNESRLVRCRFCGWICDPLRDKQIKDGSAAGKGIDYGEQKSATLTHANGTTETVYYYEPSFNAGCPQCGSYMYQ